MPLENILMYILVVGLHLYHILLVRSERNHFSFVVVERILTVIWLVYLRKPLIARIRLVLPLVPFHRLLKILVHRGLKILVILSFIKVQRHHPILYWRCCFDEKFFFKSLNSVLFLGVSLLILQRLKIQNCLLWLLGLQSLKHSIFIAFFGGMSIQWCLDLAMDMIYPKMLLRPNFDEHFLRAKLIMAMLQNHLLQLQALIWESIV